MHEQFLCHWTFAELAEPGKTSWNLEPWRPEVTPEVMLASRMQSRRQRGTVLMGGYTRAQVAALVDHTLLKPEATAADVEKLVAEAADLGVFSVCVSPSLVATAAAAGAAPDWRWRRCPASRRASTWPRSRPGNRSWPWRQVPPRSTW